MGMRRMGGGERETRREIDELSEVFNADEMKPDRQPQEVDTLARRAACKASIR